MTHVFEIVDRSGRKIRLTSERWKHIVQEHPGITDPEEIRAALVQPLVIRPSIYDPQHVRWYYRFHKEMRSYLMVAVKYLNGDGFVVTAYYMKNLK